MWRRTCGRFGGRFWGRVRTRCPSRLGSACKRLVPTARPARDKVEETNNEGDGPADAGAAALASGVIECAPTMGRALECYGSADGHAGRDLRPARIDGYMDDPQARPDREEVRQ